MKIVHVCLTDAVVNKKYAYQENLLTKYQSKLGHEVSIIAPPYSEYDKKTGKVISVKPGVEIINDGIKLIRLRSLLPCGINQHIHLFSGLGATIKELSPDLIFVHGVSSLNYGFFKGFKKRHPEVSIVYDNHADFNNSGKNAISYYYSRYIVRNFVVRKLIGTSNFFYGVTPARCDYLHDMYKVPNEKIHLLPLGADDDEMQFEHREALRKVVRDKYDISSDDFLIVTGGRIDPVKNIHVLAEAVSKSEYKHIKLLIFGSIQDELKDTFDRLSSDRIICIGWQPSNEVYRYFYAADLAVFPGLHSVLWEQAVASQVPCAFSRIKGFEHVDIGGNCVLMDGKTAVFYQALIEELYNNKTKYQELLQKARSKKSEQFLYGKIAQKVLDDIKK